MRVLRGLPTCHTNFDRRRVAILNVNIVGGHEIEWLVFEVRFTKREALGGLNTDQLRNCLKLELAVVVLRRDQLLERLTVAYVLDVLANRLDEQIRPIFVKELRDRVQPVDEILRGLEVDASQIVAFTHLMCTFCTWLHNGFCVCTERAYQRPWEKLFTHGDR